MARHPVGKQALVQSVESQISAILSQQRRASAAELIDLIHQINPTGRGLSRSVEQHRYLLKSRLQSLLLRRFGAEVEILPEFAKPGIVLLRHRYADRGDAAHAVVAELDEDVRSAVQRHLDTSVAVHAVPPWTSAPSIREAPPSVVLHPEKLGADDLSWNELVERGRVAISEYDYEAARNDLERAFHLSGGAKDAALPLCELLVEYLAADGDALQLEPSLSATAQPDPAVRALLAMAAARSGEPVEAERLLRGVDEARGAPVWLVLIERALREGKAEAAAEGMERGRAAGLDPPTLLRLTEQLQILRRTKWKGIEEELLRALDEGNPERVEAEAHDLLARWPESPAARKVLARLHERRRRHEQDQLLREAQAALDSGDLERAAAHSHAARSLGADTTSLEQTITTAQKAARYKRDQAAVEQVLTALGASVDTPALLAYAKLGEPLRTRVRRSTKVAALGWLEEMGVSGAGCRALGAVAAALALQRAASLTDPAAVLSELRAHEKTLAHVAAFHQLYGAAQTALAIRRREESEERLVALEAALERQDLEGAHYLLSEIDAKALDLPGRERLHQLTDRLKKRMDLQRQAELLNKQMLAGDLLAAKETAAAIVGSCEPGERDTWLWVRSEVEEHIRKDWLLREVCDEKTPLSELAHVGAVIASGSLPIWLTSQQGLLTIASSYQEWLFLWQIDTVEQRLRRAVVMRTPAPLRHARAWASRDGVWVVGEQHLLVLDSTATHIQGWRDLSRFGSEDTILTEILPLPDAGFVWLCCGNDSERALIVDARRWRIRREVKDVSNVVPIHGNREPLVASLGFEEPLRLFDASGTTQERPNFHGAEVTSMALHPSGDGFIGLVAAEQQETGETRLDLVESGRRTAQLPLPNSDSEMAQALVSSLSQRMSFAAYTRPGDDVNEVHAFLWEEDLMKPAWQVEAPNRIAFAQGIDAKITLMLSPTATGCSLAELGQNAPRIETCGPSDRELPALTAASWCVRKQVELPQELRQELADLRKSSPDRRRTSLSTLRTMYAASPDALFAMSSYLNREEEEGHLDFISQRYPDHPLLLFQRAHRDLASGAFDAVRTRFEQVALESLPEDHRQHALHLMGIALLHEGDSEGAREAWQRAQELPGLCQVWNCMEWLDALKAAQSSSAAPQEQRFMDFLAAGLHAADVHLDRGDHEGARRALEHPVLLAANEAQSMARLTAAYLGLSPQDETALFRFHKALVLARFCAWNEHPWLDRNVIIPGATWDAVRFEELKRQAMRWLNDSFSTRSTEADLGVT